MSESALGKANSGNAPDGKEFSCPRCGKGYNSKGGLKYHMRQCSPEELTACPTCDKRFLTDYGVKQHHANTHNKSLCKSEYECDQCGELTLRVDKNVKGQHTFCSIECKSSWQSENLNKENNPNYEPERHETRECVYCGSDFDFYLGEAEAKENAGKYCSTDCMDKWRSENWVGENNPLYKGGETYYGENWHRKRRACLERDNYTCQHCGVTESELGRCPSVHHIHPIRKFDNPKQANALRNLVTLCESCHSKWEGLYLRPDTR